MLSAAFPTCVVSKTSGKPQRSTVMNGNQVDSQVVERFSQEPPTLRPTDLDSLRVGHAVAVSRNALM